LLVFLVIELAIWLLTCPLNVPVVPLLASGEDLELFEEGLRPLLLGLW